MRYMEKIRKTQNDRLSSEFIFIKQALIVQCKILNNKRNLFFVQFCTLVLLLLYEIFGTFNNSEISENVIYEMFNNGEKLRKNLKTLRLKSL